MQTNSKISRGIAALAMSIALLAPTISYAQTQDATSNTIVPQKNFCSIIDKRADTIINNADARLTTWNQKVADQLAKLEDNRNKQTQKLEEARSKADQKREDGFAKALSKATTDDQKTAVAAFKTSITTAISIRRGAVDQAINDYRTGVDTALKTRHDGMQANLTTLKTAVTSAINQAKTDCKNGKDPKTTRQTLVTAISTARKQFQSSKQTLEQAKTEIITLRKNRETAIQKAITDFKTTATQARTTLKTALNKK